jgi:hypothetical protein
LLPERPPRPGHGGLLILLKATSILLQFNKIVDSINIVKSSPHPMTAPAPPLAAWLAILDEDDVQFLRRFVLSSGSLKALAEEYEVSYPTVRARLDRLIAKVEAASDPRIADPFQRKLKVLAADGEISPRLARELLEAHRAALQGAHK